jgi:hypothetical protein
MLSCLHVQGPEKWFLFGLSKSIAICPPIKTGNLELDMAVSFRLMRPSTFSSSLIFLVALDTMMN